jgi:hypothetical protein
VAGDHSLRTDLGAVEEAVRAWLLGVFDAFEVKAERQ